uniref:ATP synthase F0 subunit 8 n=1 Tax=Lycosa sp. TaxID=3013955 RepID=A0A9E9FWJ5_9ARAC|nr:ATP synthase F0 subunit 8 [Lycosa sp.]
MPFYWINSVFMVLCIILTSVFFYFYKNMENMKLGRGGIFSVGYSFMW